LNPVHGDKLVRNCKDLVDLIGIDGVMSHIRHRGVSYQV
jgi:hypothetical protein